VEGGKGLACFFLVDRVLDQLSLLVSAVSTSPMTSAAVLVVFAILFFQLVARMKPK